MDKIELLEDGKVLFEKGTWYQEETEVAESLYLTKNNGRYVADLTQTSKEALFKFMKFCYGNFVKTDRWKKVRSMLYEGLKDTYDEMYESFDKVLKKLPYYDKLYQHQKEAIFVMCNRRHNLLSFEQGLGKSITSASLSILTEVKKTLIVCPAICKWNWYHELMRWGIHDDDISIVDSKKSKNSKNERFIIINYDILDKFYDKLMKRDIGHLISDECHYVKNTKTKRFKSLKRIVISKKPKVSLLTGTPIKNKVIDLFAYLKLVSHPMGKNYQQFVENYTFYYDNSWGMHIVKGKNLRELSAKLSNFIIRKTKDECLDLPEKIITKYHFELEDYLDEYNACLEEAVKKKHKNNIELEGSIHSLNILTAKSKIKSISKLIEDLVYEGKKVVVFSSYKEPLRMLHEKFKEESVLIDGSVPAEKRQNLIDEFKKKGKTNVLLGNIIAAGVGINLENSSDVIFVNFPFTISELEQAIDRLHRIGQKNQVNVYYTICSGTVDEHIYNMIANKAQDVNIVIDEKDNADIQNVPSELFNKLLEEYEQRQDG